MCDISKISLSRVRYNLNSANCSHLKFLDAPNIPIIKFALSLIAFSGNNSQYIFGNASCPKSEVYRVYESVVYV